MTNVWWSFIFMAVCIVAVMVVVIWKEPFKEMKGEEIIYIKDVGTGICFATNSGFKQKVIFLTFVPCEAVEDYLVNK